MTDHRRRSTRATIRVETLEDRLAPVPVNPSHAHLVAIGGAALAHAMGDHRLPDGNTGGSHRSIAGPHHSRPVPRPRARCSG